MTATPLSASVRYFPPTHRKYYWVVTIADYTAPTRSELNAGTDLTGEIVAGAVSGFQTVSATVDAPDADTRFTVKIPGRITADNSSIDLYTSSDSADARTLLARDETGYIVIFPEGDVTGHKMNIFPVTIASSSIAEGTEEAGRLSVNFTVTGEPAENVVVPA